MTLCSPLSQVNISYRIPNPNHPGRTARTCDLSCSWVATWNHGTTGTGHVRPWQHWGVQEPLVLAGGSGSQTWWGTWFLWRLNSVSQFDAYPMLCIDKLFNYLEKTQKGKYFWTRFQRKDSTCHASWAFTIFSCALCTAQGPSHIPCAYGLSPELPQPVCSSLLDDIFVQFGSCICYTWPLCCNYWDC